MKKLVGRTIGITLAAVLGFFAVFSGIIVLFCPNVYGRIFSNLGCYSSSTWCFERQYNITKNTNDLAVLVLNLSEEDDRLNEYSYLLITDSNYSDYISSNAQKYFITEEKAEEYFYSKCAVAKFDANDFQGAMTVITSFYTKFGYTKYSPMRNLIAKRLNNFTESQVEIITQKINSLKSQLVGEQLSFAESDLTMLNSIK